MIKVTMLNDREITINAELIEAVERNHDTIITLTTGRRFTVKDTDDEIVAKVVYYRQCVNGVHPALARR